MNFDLNSLLSYSINALQKSTSVSRLECPKTDLHRSATACFSTDDEPGIFRTNFSEATKEELNLLGDWSFNGDVGVGRYETWGDGKWQVGILYTPVSDRYANTDLASGKKAIVEIIVEKSPYSR